MNPMVKIGGKLALICAVAALALGIVNAMTEPQIARIKAERLQEALELVGGDYTVMEPVEVDGAGVVDSYYPLQDNGKRVGYICRLIGAGYGGDMVILARYDQDGVIRSVKLMENEETPGLGKEAERPEYMDKFIGTGGEEPIPVRKDMLTTSQADSITGATITFIGLGKALESGSAFVEGVEE
jgi:Na+-translocating ferredoxin:NAD+ oxidoreductase subunit G